MPPRGKEFTDRWAKPAQGMVYHKHIKVGCQFDPQTFAYLRSRALRDHTSFAEQVRLHVEWGRESLRDSASSRSPERVATIALAVRGNAPPTRSK